MNGHRARANYWTVERLQRLLALLLKIAKEDEQGLYLEPLGLRRYVQTHASRHDLQSDMATVRNGLKLLMVLDVLEEGMAAPFPPGYKRRLFPAELVDVEDAAIDRYWRAVSARKSQRRARQQ